MLSVALATCLKLPEPDDDEVLLVGALEAAGVRVRLVAWDDPAAVFEAGELVVIRSTWNYYRDVEGFLGWVERTAAKSRLLNPASVVRGNARKTYLRELEARGVAIVPTVFVSRGERASIADVMRSRAWEAIVIKPVVSAGSFLTQRFESETASEAQLFLEQLTTERDVMVQRWMPSVGFGSSRATAHGERALVWIDGELTHSIRKSPRFNGGGEAVSPELPIAPDERAFAERVLATIDVPAAEPLLYARIDMVKDDDGVLRLMELELIEPSLYLEQCPRALERLSAAIVSRARA